MNSPLPLPGVVRRFAWPLFGLVVVVVAVLFRDAWWPRSREFVRQIVSHQSAQASEGDAHDHAAGEDAHAHEGHKHAHAAGAALELSPQAQANLGLTPDQLRPVALTDYSRSTTVPAIVVERPGRTRIEISAPLSGVVTAVHAISGAAVEPGQLLFEMRLTHEELVQAQVDFLRALVERDVEIQEIERLRPLVEMAGVPITMIREREYAKAKLDGLLSAQREALRLHGLSEAQVEGIASQRRLLRSVQVVVPSGDGQDSEDLRLTLSDLQTVSYDEEGAPISTDAASALVVQELRVHKGQAVDAGTTLCVLADYSELYIEGAAFEQDARAIADVTTRGATVDAVFDEPGHQSDVVRGLSVEYLANEVDVDSRTLHFYVRLPNIIVRDSGETPQGRFVSWQYRPGQRLQIRVPVESWEQQIVLPVDAVARDGAEFFVFLKNGNHFDRTPVHVKYRDQQSAVIANDGSIFPGDVVARRGAHQMLIALKNKSGGAVDPHAGHNH